MTDISELSERELLERVLTGLSDQKTFELGVLMGVMRKGDSEYISRLEHKVEELKGTVAALSDCLEDRGDEDGGEG